MEKKSYKNKNSDEKDNEPIGGVIHNDPGNYPMVGKWKQFRPIVDMEKCIGCGKCTFFCPEAALSLGNFSGKKKAVVSYDFCKGEGICVGICPVGAIEMKR